MEIKDLRQRENDPDLPTHIWWEVPPLLKILFPGFLNRDFSVLKYQLVYRFFVDSKIYYVSKSKSLGQRSMNFPSF